MTASSSVAAMKARIRRAVVPDAILRPFQSLDFIFGHSYATVPPVAPMQSSLPAVASPTQSAGTPAEASRSKSLVPAPSMPEGIPEPVFGPRAMRLLVELEVSVPVREFRVRQLLGLAPGQVIASEWTNGTDLPLAVGEVQLAWTEFEVVESKLAVRIARIA
jgi:flagellar motor switch protein FliN